MRQKIGHDYLGVDDDIVWEVVTADLPVLVRWIRTSWWVTGPQKKTVRFFARSTF